MTRDNTGWLTAGMARQTSPLEYRQKIKYSHRCHFRFTKQGIRQEKCNLTPGLRAWTKVSKNQWNLFLLICNATSEISLLAINLLFFTHFLVSWCLFWNFYPRGHEWTIFGLSGTSAPDQFSLRVVSARKIFRFVKIFGLIMLQISSGGCFKTFIWENQRKSGKTKSKGWL